MKKWNFDLLTYGTISIIALGMLKQLLYYYAFDVPIKYFLGIPDLGLFVSEDFFIIIPVVIFLGYHIRENSKIHNRELERLRNLEISQEEEAKLVIEEKRELIRLKKLLQIILEQKDSLSHGDIQSTVIRIKELEAQKEIREKRNASYKKTTKSFQIVMIISTLCMLMLTYKDLNSIYNSSYTSKLNFTIIISLIVFYSLTIIRQFWPKTYFYFLPTEYFYGIFFSLILIISVVCVKTSYDISSVADGKYFGTVIKTSDSTYKSNNNSYFIGKTSEYVFIFDAKNGTRVLRNEQIIDFVLKSK